MSSPDADLLIHDHDELGGLLHQLITALEARDIARSHAKLDWLWARLAMHIRAEHLHLFPAILDSLNAEPTGDLVDRLALGEPQKVIADLREDHNFFMLELSESIVILRRLLDHGASDASGRLDEVVKRIEVVRERLVKHNQIEEQGVYLWTSTLLTQPDRAELVAKVHKELENVPPRFRGA